MNKAPLRSLFGLIFSFHQFYYAITTDSFGYSISNMGSKCTMATSYSLVSEEHIVIAWEAYLLLLFSQVLVLRFEAEYAIFRGSL